MNTSIFEFDHQKYIKFEKTVQDNGVIWCSMILYSEKKEEIEEFNVLGGICFNQNNKYRIGMYLGYKIISEIDFELIAVSEDVENIQRNVRDNRIVAYEYKWNCSSMIQR
jgi:hypothetical protein